MIRLKNDLESTLGKLSDACHLVGSIGSICQQYRYHLGNENPKRYKKIKKHLHCVQDLIESVKQSIGDGVYTQVNSNLKKIYDELPDDDEEDDE